jgi:glycosyltransferase involved in cell wall biosynthesis
MGLSKPAAPRIAVIHDWLISSHGGSERVLHQILNVFPSADVYALLDKLPDDHRYLINHREVNTSFLQKAPGAERHYRYLLPLMPLAVESFDLSQYDLVLSSSHAASKGVLTGPKQLHICYCHTPIRYAWDLQHQYLAESGLNRGIRKWLALGMLHYIRMWDLRTVPGVDYFIANSDYVARRIKKVYGRESIVIYPPIDVDKFEIGEEREDFYVVVARLVPYKRVGLLLEAFESMPDRQLVVIGTGPLMERLLRATPSNVRFIGNQSFDSMRSYLQRARAFLYAAEEDFGMSLVEAQACGTPVISYRAGGALETVVDGQTGILFEDQTPESIVQAIRRFEAIEQRMAANAIRENALRFSAAHFRWLYHSVVLDYCRAQDFNSKLRAWAETQSSVATAVAAEMG